MHKLFLTLVICLLLSCGSCYLAKYPVTPKVAESATYKLFANDESQGTGWAVSDHYIMTAGHMCEYNEDNYIAVSNTERRFRLHSVAWEKSLVDGQTDLCLLKSEAKLPNTLVIADEMPKVGDKIGYVGYPNGEYSEHEGKYLGDIDGPENQGNDFAFSAWADHGASGSALFTDRGVWGVLVRLRTDGGFVHDPIDGGVAIPLDKIKKFLDDMEVKYEVTPDDPVQTDPFADPGMD